MSLVRTASSSTVRRKRAGSAPRDDSGLVSRPVPHYLEYGENQGREETQQVRGDNRRLSRAARHSGAKGARETPSRHSCGGAGSGRVHQLRNPRVSTRWKNARGLRSVREARVVLPGLGRAGIQGPAEGLQHEQGNAALRPWEAAAGHARAQACEGPDRAEAGIKGSGAGRCCSRPSDFCRPQPRARPAQKMRLNDCRKFALVWARPDSTFLSGPHTQTQRHFDDPI